MDAAEHRPPAVETSENQLPVEFDFQREQPFMDMPLLAGEAGPGRNQVIGRRQMNRLPTFIPQGDQQRGQATSQIRLRSL